MERGMTDALEETLVVFEDAARGEPLTTNEVADALDVGRRSTYDRLERLADLGHLDTKKVGARGRVWWPTSDSTTAGGDEASDGAIGYHGRVGENPHRHEALGDVLERISDGFYSLDEEWRFTYVNGRTEDLFGVDEANVLGRDIRETFQLTDRFEAALREASDRQEPVTLEDYYEPFDAWFDNSIYPSPTGLSVYFRDVTERKERERRLERQRDRLASMNNLNRVTRNVTEAVIDQSTREAIERTVCEAFADDDAYEFAWFAEIDPATGSVEKRVEAGVDGYVDGIALSTDADDPAGRGPTGRAIRTKEAFAVGDVFEDPAFEQWRDAAREYGYRAAIAIPAVDEETLYGVFGVYADREGAFAGEERRMLAQLGEVVGHAIAAVERKRALMSDEVVELEFRAENVFEVRGVDVPADGWIALDRAVPTSDGDYLIYGSASPDAVDTLEVLTERPRWESLSILEDADDAVRFRVRLTGSSVLSKVASRGGSVERAVFADGDFYLTLHLVPGVEVRALTDALREVYPTVELLSRRQVPRAPDTIDPLHRVLEDDLTDRQRAALEAAYQAGFFEWPRDSSGEEVAAAIGVAGATFHQHLRTAQRKVFGSILRASED
jgi:PAS domain S-box-containing protein